MLDEDMLREAVLYYTKNPSWMNVYENAPTELSRRYQALKFFYGFYDEQMEEDEALSEEYNRECKDLEQEMSLQDWEYLYKYSGNNPFKTKCCAKIEELKVRQQAEEQPTGE